VKDREHNRRICANPEVHRIWKAARDRASNIPKYNWVTLGSGRSSRDSFLNFYEKFLAESVALLVVPYGCILKLAFFAARRKTTRSVIAPDAIEPKP
jgi:hypothetical protein